MDSWLTVTDGQVATPLIVVDRERFAATVDALGAPVRRWCESNGFAGDSGRWLALPDGEGGNAAILVGSRSDAGPYALAWLPLTLPAGNYRLDSRGLALDAADCALGWALGAYQFTRYRKPARAAARLLVDTPIAQATKPLAQAAYLVRDLVNTPTEDLGPEQLATCVRELAAAHSAQVCEWVGDELLAANFPTIHAVGRASHRAPRLVQLTHGPAGAPHLILIGKGVCFDSGGLDIKTADGMRWMKKDMGGAAHAIALAQLVLTLRLPVRLTLLVPAVENSIAGNALRPGEVVVTRSGLSVEIDNTDAEGRLILCDALAYAAEHKPDLILDFATLTGAARVALGPDLPALFANRDDIAEQLVAASFAAHDPLWRLPLWRPYLPMLESHVADLANAGASRHAGAITAALYLERFVPEAQPWAHLDVYAWNDAAKPGRPRGGEAQGLRAYLRFLEQRYA
ncbi:MAG: leucyl aminopeptidase family protein [Dokdonella sp.]|uniref:leucyl aminopeptidase family protein n=1 Tax=Dokdonella sp. TaxID=2291710 RepID=UPI0025C37CDF|nr:leucyl aminopeptidase family protein [Dokdonella sp.]MBZ0221466.1 leucyl aminopeptidase family protein [Dokdonella sp.]